MSDCRQCADFEWCMEYEECGLFKQKPQTNADRIRAMTDEELAEWIEQLESPKCPCDDWFYRCEKWNCNGCWLNWLKQEAKE